jgi:hypothetical protein
MPQNPDILIQKASAQYLIAPDGTTAPDQGGTEIDLTGFHLTAAPQANAAQSGSAASIVAVTATEMTVAGLHLMQPSSVGRDFTINATNPANRGTFPITAYIDPNTIKVGNTTPGVAPDTIGAAGATTATASAPVNGRVTLTGLADFLPSFIGRTITLSNCVTAANNGAYVILAVLSATSVQISSSAATFPDIGLGPGITWTLDVVPSTWSEAVNPAEFPPGDPLTNVAERQYIPLNIVQDVTGPPTFADYEPLLGPLVKAPPPDAPTIIKGIVYAPLVSSLSPPSVGPPVNPPGFNTGGVNEKPTAIYGTLGAGRIQVNDLQNRPRIFPTPQGPLLPGPPTGFKREKLDDPQNPVRFSDPALFPNMPDGRNQPMPDGPRSTNYGVFKAVKAP